MVMRSSHFICPFQQKRRRRRPNPFKIALKIVVLPVIFLFHDNNIIAVTATRPTSEWVAMPLPEFSICFCIVCFSSCYSMFAYQAFIWRLKNNINTYTHVWHAKIEIYDAQPSCITTWAEKEYMRYALGK